MPIRINDPQSLEKWIVKTDQRLRELEARRIDAAEGLTQDHATKQMMAKISEDPGNSAMIGEDGGIYSADTITTAADHSPLLIQKYMTAAQGIDNNLDELISWSATYTSGNWTSDATSITIPEDGFYFCAIQWPWVQNVNGNRVVHVTLNSTAPTTGSSFVATANPAAGEVSCVMTDGRLFVTGDILRCYAYQNSGTNPLNGGGPYFGDIRGRWTLWKFGDAAPPELTTSTAETTTA